jgi:hypothetical protein
MQDELLYSDQFDNFYAKKPPLTLKGNQNKPQQGSQQNVSLTKVVSQKNIDADQPRSRAFKSFVSENQNASLKPSSSENLNQPNKRPIDLSQNNQKPSTSSPFFGKDASSKFTSPAPLKKREIPDSSINNPSFKGSRSNPVETSIKKLKTDKDFKTFDKQVKPIERTSNVKENINFHELGRQKSTNISSEEQIYKDWDQNIKKLNDFVLNIILNSSKEKQALISRNDTLLDEVGKERETVESYKKKLETLANSLIGQRKLNSIFSVQMESLYNSRSTFMVSFFKIAFYKTTAI